MTEVSNRRTGRFLLAGHDAGGTVPPMLAIAEVLVARGHDVAWLGQPSIGARASNAGCSFIAFDAIGDYEPRRSIEEQIELATTVIAGRAIGDQVLAVAGDRRSEVLVLDCNLAGAAAAAETSGLPSALLLHSMYRTFTDVWFADLWPFVGPLVNSTRHSFGLPQCTSWPEVFGPHDRLFAVVPPGFDAPIDRVPPSMRHFGFLIPTGDGNASAPERPPGDGPLVLVGLSTTYQHQERLLQTILDAVAISPVRALVTTGGQVDGNSVAIPPNAIVRDFVPHALVLPHVDAVITHAGLGTVAGALHHGVPLVCAPIGRDQPLNAERVADVGAGVALPADPVRDQVADALERVLSDPSFRGAARSVAEESRKAGGAAAAVAELESLLSVEA